MRSRAVRTVLLVSLSTELSPALLNPLSPSSFPPPQLLRPLSFSAPLSPSAPQPLLNPLSGERNLGLCQRVRRVPGLSLVEDQPARGVDTYAVSAGKLGYCSSRKHKLSAAPADAPAARASTAQLAVETAQSRRKLLHVHRATQPHASACIATPLTTSASKPQLTQVGL